MRRSPEIFPAAAARYKTAAEEICRKLRHKKDGVYAECGIYTVPFSVLDYFLRQAKRFLEKNVSSYKSPSSV